VSGRSRFWDELAADVTARFPLAAVDWVQHSDSVDAGLYSVQNRTARPTPAKVQLHNFAEEPPLSPDEEEAAYAQSMAPAQMELF